jgi:hypothetical protein
LEEEGQRMTTHAHSQQLPPRDVGLPGPAAGGDKAARDRWPTDKKLAFSTLAPASLSLVATDGPISGVQWCGSGGGIVQRWGGDNRGVWPAKLARGSTWTDNASAAYDRGPLHHTRTRIRLWARDDAARDRLALAVGEMIEMRRDVFGTHEAMINGFRDLGPELDMDLFELDIVGVAERLGIWVRDDDALSLYLDRVLAQAQRMVAGRGGQIDSRVLERAARAVG